MEDDRKDRRRRWALYALCSGVLMMGLDTTIVTVALPSILGHFHIGSRASSWVLNAYMLTFGGLLIVAGRVGDFFGARRVFLLGMSVFTLSSLACGLAPDLAVLIICRAVQGVGAAMVTAVSLALIASLFAGAAERAWAIGVYGFVCAVGGAAGDMLGGLLTGSLSWHWIFLVNLPVGMAVFALCAVLLPADVRAESRGRLDVAGALMLTSAATLLVNALINGNALGWSSAPTCSGLFLVVLLLVAFALHERRMPRPLLPARVLRLRNFVLANVVGGLWTAGMFSWFVVSALYMQRVLGYGPFEVGLAYLPSETLMALFAAGFSARMVNALGRRAPLRLGLLVATLGLLLFARVPAGGSFLVDVLPGMLLVGLGGGIASSPVILLALDEVPTVDSGLASGVLNTCFVLGGAFGIAAASSLAGASGYTDAFRLSAALAAVAAVLALVAVRASPLTSLSQVIESRASAREPLHRTGS